MMKQFICIRCPKGCIIDVEIQDKEIISVTGNTCPRGKEYVTEEVVEPKRMVTSTIKVTGGIYKVLSVATDKPINKELVFKLMEELKKIELKSPIKMNDIIISNVLGTDVNIIATRSI